MKRFNQWLALADGSAVLTCSGCADSNPDTKTTAVETYADIALASYEDSLFSAILGHFRSD